MKMSFQFFAALGILGILFLFPMNAVQAQWPEDPAVNMILSDRAGSQVMPKIEPTSDGGCYILWWDNTSGNYDIYLQRLNSNGDMQWEQNGLLISSRQQDSWVTDWDLAVDSSDYAIIAVNDIRQSANRDIFAYRISPSGEFSWGPDGIEMSDGIGFKADPQIVVTSAGNIVFAWQEDFVLNIHKVTPEGIDSWNPPIITMSYTYALSIARLAIADNDGFIIQYLQAQGSGWSAPKYLLAQKYNADGVAQWADGVTISSGGAFSMGARPGILSDGTGGAYSYWYEDRTFYVFRAYGQHVDSNGNVLWTANGVPFSTATSPTQSDPTIAIAPGTGNIIAFYQLKNSNQDQWGIGGQMLDASGARQWGSTGITYEPLSTAQRGFLLAVPQDSGAIVIYLESPPGDAVHSYTKAFRVNMAGTEVWDPSPIQIGATLSAKGHPFVNRTINGQAVAAWEDDRVDANGDLILQNVNPDGTFGPLPPSGCSYIPGDINGNGTPNGIDVVFGVNYFKGLSTPPVDCYPFCPGISSPFYAAGDVNGNCQFNGIDITFFVRYLKGQVPEILYCVDCPPAP